MKKDILQKVAGFFNKGKIIKAHNEYTDWFNQPENIDTINKHYSKAAKKLYNKTLKELGSNEQFPAYQLALQTSGFDKIRENFYKKYKLENKDIIN